MKQTNRSKDKVQYQQKGKTKKTKEKRGEKWKKLKITAVKKKNAVHSGKRFLILVIRKKKPSSPKMSQSNDLLVSSPEALCCAQCFSVRVFRDCNNQVTVISGENTYVL